jgi:hypothetical protein
MWEKKQKYLVLLLAFGAPGMNESEFNQPKSSREKSWKN